MSRHNLDAIAVLDGSPAWARSTDDARNRFAPPEEVRDFGAYAALFAERYGDQIDYYQIWDEPNIAPHWGAREVDLAAFGRRLREGAIQIGFADPDSITILSALAPNVESGGANMSELQFLDALYEWGGAEWFDIVAAQPYAFGQDPNSEPAPGQLNWRRVELLRAVMVSTATSEQPCGPLRLDGLRVPRTAWPRL